MKQTGSILLGTIMVYILLSIASYYIIFSEVNNFAVSRTVLGVIVLSLGHHYVCREENY